MGFRTGIALFLTALPLLAADPVSGEAVYQKRCAVCHEQASPRVPPRMALETMSATRISRALNSGVMLTIAYPLTRDERDAVAAYGQGWSRTRPVAGGLLQGSNSGGG